MPTDTAMTAAQAPVELLPRIYDVVARPKAWCEVLDELNAHLEGVAVSVVLCDAVFREIRALWTSSSLAALVPEYVSRFASLERPVFESVRETVPQMQFTPLPDILTRYNTEAPEPATTEDVDSWLRREAAVASRCCTPLGYAPNYLAVATCHMPSDSAERQQARVAAGDFFLPHLAKAVEFSRPFSLLKARFDAVLDVLDRCHIGVLFLTQSGTVALGNRESARILEQRDGVFLDHRGRLRLSEPSAARALSRMLGALSRHDWTDATTASGRHFVPRSGSELAYVVELSLTGESELQSTDMSCVAFLMDPNHRSVVDTHGLKQLFALSDAEASVLDLIVSGNGTDEIADIRGTTVETTRTQIKSLRSKTGARRREELTRLALSVNLPVDPAPACAQTPLEAN